ncbi:MAG: 2Fe-2S iron-sulfur cluster-binding protein [Candidatus Puniceispirillales bacterium]|jgi:ferredoxin|tara:strand:- start:118 stop:414 length:297 start_codon:yes stop_codon:yes gene_type:complete
MKICFITNNNQVVNFDEETSLLRVSIRYKAGMPFKCGGGICGTCRCVVEKGMKNTNKLTKKELNILSQDEINSSIRLACQTIVNGSLSVSWEDIIKKK